MAKKYVKALYANADDIKEDIDEYFLREEDEEETFDDVSTADILNPNIHKYIYLIQLVIFPFFI